MGLITADDGWRMPDFLWARIQPLLPKHSTNHPLNRHRQRIDERVVMNAILLVLRTGCQWQALRAMNLGVSGTTAWTRFNEWSRAGVFADLWQQGLLAYDDAVGIDWSWLSMDGCMTKAPLGGEATGHNPTDRGKLGTKRSVLVERTGLPLALTIDGANRHDSRLFELSPRYTRVYSRSKRS